MKNSLLDQLFLAEQKINESLKKLSERVDAF